MKAIPEQFGAYFPNATDPARPWWEERCEESGEDGDVVVFERNDGCETDTLNDRDEIDKANPLPPPPILVGQVWAQPNDDGGMRAAQVSAVTYESDGTVTVHWVSGHVATDDTWLYLHGFLLRGDYAPWSGPEVAP